MTVEVKCIIQLKMGRQKNRRFPQAPNIYILYTVMHYSSSLYSLERCLASQNGSSAAKKPLKQGF